MCRNFKKLENPLSFDKILEQFQDVFDESSITAMEGEPMHIYLDREDPNYRPARTLTARPIPIHQQDEAKKVIQMFEKSGVIERVREPTEWISPAFFVPKSNGSVRLVTDYTKINKFISRPVHPFSSPLDILKGVRASSKVFLKLDAVQGFYQIPLDEESSKLTTFLLPDGRWKFTRGPMGMNSTSDEWNIRSDDALHDIDIQKIVDDVLLQGETEQEVLNLLVKCLERCRKHNITLSRKKVEFGESVRFAGFVISKGGIKPDPERLDALAKFPVPKDLTALRGFMGLSNQFAIFVPDLTHVSDPLRKMTMKNAVFDWRPEHQGAFEQIKKMLTSPLVVKPFDPRLPTQLLTDASRLYGIGYALVQLEGNGFRLIQCGSRSLLPAESNYATIELELLAIQWAVHTCRFFFLGIKTFEILTDHKPLVGIIEKPMSEITNRLLRIREKLLDYRFTIKWVEGKTHFIADALSRAPVFTPDESEIALLRSIVADNFQKEENSLNALVSAASKDENYKKIVEAFQQDASMHSLPPQHPAKALRSIWDEVALFKNLIVHQDRILVPISERKDILQKLHIAHAGINRTKKLARQHYYWPGMSSQIEQMINKCEKCQMLRPSLPQEPLQMLPDSPEPFDDISMDLMQANQHQYLVVTDRYSGYPFIHQLRKLDTESILRYLRTLFCEWGFPRRIMTDDGPQFRGPFNEFCKKYFISHEISSAYHPQSNGLAESAVKNMKYLIMKLDSLEELPMALMHWRNTPRADGDLSPAELFLGRRQRRLLPVLSLPSPGREPTLPSSLRELKVGQKVRMQNPSTRYWDALGTVKAVRDSGRSYLVMSGGREFLRNRVLLRPYAGGVDTDADQKGRPEDFQTSDQHNPLWIDAPPPDQPSPPPSPPLTRSRAQKRVSFSPNLNFIQIGYPHTDNHNGFVRQ